MRLPNRKNRKDAPVDDLSTAEGANSLAFYLVSRFIVVLILVMLTEWAVVAFDAAVLAPVLAGLVTSSAGVDVVDGSSLFALLQWAVNFVRAIAQGNYLQVPGLAAGSVAVLTTLLMAVTLVAPMLVGATVFARLVVRKMRALQLRREQELAQIDRQRSQFITDVAHDLRTPVMAISGMAHALDDGLVRDPAMRDEYVRSICEKSDKLGTLVTSVFDYTKLGSASFSLQMQDVDLPQLLLQEAAMAYTDVEDAGMHFSVHVPEERCVVHADPVQLARVVSNLIANAVRHNGESTEIALILAQRSGTAFVMVADTGTAIYESPDELFQPFVQGDTSRSKPGGSGLGLSICKRVADMHGFALELAQPYGRFTKAFVLRCPIVD